MYEQVIADSALASLAADLWQSKYVGFWQKRCFIERTCCPDTLASGYLVWPVDWASLGELLDTTRGSPSGIRDPSRAWFP